MRTRSFHSHLWDTVVSLLGKSGSISGHSAYPCPWQKWSVLSYDPIQFISLAHLHGCRTGPRAPTDTIGRNKIFFFFSRDCSSLCVSLLGGFYSVIVWMWNAHLNTARPNANTREPQTSSVVLHPHSALVAGSVSASDPTENFGSELSCRFVWGLPEKAILSFQHLCNWKEISGIFFKTHKNFILYEPSKLRLSYPVYLMWDCMSMLTHPVDSCFIVWAMLFQAIIQHQSFLIVIARR